MSRVEDRKSLPNLTNMFSNGNLIAPAYSPYTLKDPNGNPILGCPMKRSKQLKDNYDVKILCVLSPIFCLFKYMGLFPFKFNCGGLAFVKRGSLVHSLTVISLIIVISYVTFHSVSLILSINAGIGLTETFGQIQWLLTCILPLALSLRMFNNPELVNFFEECMKFEQCIQLYVCKVSLKKFARKSFLFYGIIAGFSITLVFLHSMRYPTHPAYVLCYVPFEEITRNPLCIYLQAIAQMIIMLWKWAGATILDMIGIVLSSALKQYMDGIAMDLAKMKTENIDPNLISLPNPEGEKVDKNMFYEKTVMDMSGCPVMRGVKHFQQINDLQKSLNKILGPLYFLGIGVLTAQTCMLIFLSIHYSKVNVSMALLYSGNAACFAARIVFLIIGLGTLHSKGQEVNLAIAKKMSQLNIPTYLAPALNAHLSVFASNPVCFSAWDFFHITKGTLLAVFSVVTTYLIVFLQIQI